MDRNEYEGLLNREIDGLLSPEEEARLNDYTARHPEAAEEQRSLHEIHRAFQSMDKDPVPAGLSDRIADRVLAGPAPVRRFPGPWALNKVAAAILVVCTVGFGGWYVGNNMNAVEAGGDTTWEQEQHALWTSLGLTSEQSDELIAAKKTAREQTGSRLDAAAYEEGVVLSLLKKFGHLDRYCKERGMTLEQAQGYIDRAK